MKAAHEVSVVLCVSMETSLSSYFSHCAVSLPEKLAQRPSTVSKIYMPASVILHNNPQYNPPHRRKLTASQSERVYDRALAMLRHVS